MRSSKKSKTVFSRIFKAAIIPFICFVVIMIIAISVFTKRQSENIARQNTENFASHLSSHIEAQVSAVAGALNSARRSLSTLDLDSPSATLTAESILLSLLSSGSAIYNAWFAFEAGTFFPDERYIKSYVKETGDIIETFDVTNEKLENPLQSPWYNLPRRNGEDYYKSIDYYDYGLGNGPSFVITVSFPIFHGGKFIGCVGMDIQYEKMLNYTKELIVLDVTPSVSILAGENEVIYQAAHDRRDINEIVAASRQLDRKELEEGKALTFYLEDKQGDSHFVCVTPVYITKETNPVLLYVDLPSQAIYKYSNQIIKAMIFMGMAGFTVFVGSLLISTRAVVGPIEELREKADAIAQGKLDIDFTVDSQRYGSREVNSLYASIRSMLEQLKQNHELKLAAVSAQYENNKLQAASEAKTRFFASVSHEIRTPMNAIIGLSELLLKVSLKDPARRYVQDIKLSAQALLKVINDILDSAKMEAGKLELSPLDYNLPALVNNLCSITKLMASRKGLQFAYEHGDNIPQYLYGDSDRLRQVLLNVLNNAVKYTHKGNITLRLTNEGKNLLFVVSDTGIGIKKEVLPEIFDPFSQVGGKETKNIEGSGLGLTITKKLVELMGGEIQVESRHGEGTEFFIRLPYVVGKSTEINSEIEEGFNLRTAKILVVDDNIINLTVAQGLFEVYGLACDTAQSGQEAISLVQQNSYDIIFMDHMMPGMDGIEAMKAIRALGETYKEIPIIALTANVMGEAKDSLLEAGMDDFLAKPIEENELIAVLKRWLGNV